MKLNCIELEGLKKFKDHNRISVRGKLTAIVGPNECGKTSLMKLTENLNTDGVISPIDFSRSRSSEHFITVEFGLSDEECEILKLPANSILNIRKDSGSPNLQYEYPKELDALGDEWGDTRALISKEMGEDHTILSRSPSQVTEAEIEEIFAQNPDISDEDRGAIQSTVFGSTIENVHMYLSAQVPRFLYFSIEHRELETYYDTLDKALAAPAFQNLAKLGKLDTDGLKFDVTNGNTGKANTAIEEANRILESEFKQAFTQHEVTPILQCNSQIPPFPVAIHFKDIDTQQQFRVEERSEGLRWFVTLYAFIKSQLEDLSTPPILLVDEVEQHLHFDAQADVIREMANQELTQSVIYSTHSPGALPPNLGRVRTIEAVGPDSRISNKFWTNQDGRMSSLIMKLGASNCAFTSSKTSVFTEGPADFLLLPSLFEEINEEFESHSIQVVPGLSWYTKIQMAELDKEASDVIYLVDNDDGGESLKSDLIEVGVDEKKILTIPAPLKDTEDFLDLEVLVSACNSFFGDSQIFKASEAPGYGRGKWVESLLPRKSGQKSVTKTDISEKLLENPSILDKSRKDVLAILLSQINEALNIN